MIKSFFLLLPLIGSLFFYCTAQQTELPQKLSLQKAQKIALQNNIEVQLKNIESTIAQKKIEQAKWQKIPDIYANLDIRRNLIIPTTPVPAKAFDPNAPEDKIKPLKFMTNWSSNAGVNVKMDLFNPKTHGLVEEQKQQAAIRETEKEITKNEIFFKTGKDYAAVIIAQKQLELAVADTIHKNKVLKMTQSQSREGRIKRTNLNQINSQKNASISHYWKSKKILQSAQAQLITDLGYNPSENYSFSISDNLSTLLQRFENQSIDFTNKSSNSLYKWEQQKKLTETKIQNVRQGFLPTLSLNGFYGGNYYDNDFNFFKGENWYGNSYIGLSLNIPITQGLDRLKKIEILQLQTKKAQLNYQFQENTNQLALTQALQEWEYRKKDLKNKENEMHLSKNNLTLAKEQFLKGRLLIGDYTQSDYQYQKAKTDYLQAAYDFVIAGMNLEKIKKN